MEIVHFLKMFCFQQSGVESHIFFIFGSICRVLVEYGEMGVICAFAWLDFQDIGKFE